MSDDGKRIDFSEYSIYLEFARKEVEQNRKNLERELSEWKEKYAKLGNKLGRAREVCRIYKKHAREDALKAVKEFNRKAGEEEAAKYPKSA